MPLLVVPLAPEGDGALTLAEWDALRACELVLFERPDHPLAKRLRAEGVSVGPFDDEPEASRTGWALVADPGSPRIVELARNGADVSAGTAHAPDGLTAAHAAAIARRAGASLATLGAVMARLRSDDGCPWDREQTHESLRVHLVEEAYEVLDAIDNGLVGEDLEEELGDLLLQVFFHAQLASDDGRFDVAAVADRIVAKLIHRHPHVFGDVSVSGAADVVRNWEELKAAEKKRADPFEGIPEGLPALLLAYKVQKRAAGAGFSPGPDDVRARLEKALEVADPESITAARPGGIEAADPESIGEALFWLVAAARAAGVDPEGALRSAVRRFRSAGPASW